MSRTKIVTVLKDQKGKGGKNFTLDNISSIFVRYIPKILKTTYSADPLTTVFSPQLSLIAFDCVHVCYIVFIASSPKLLK